MALRAFLLTYFSRVPVCLQQATTRSVLHMKSLAAIRGVRLAGGFVCVLCIGINAAQTSRPNLDEDLKAAEAAYRSGQYADAADRLESLKRRYARSFEVNELLGLTYSAEGNTAKAVSELRIAAELAPKSAAAQVNLGTALVRAGQPVDAPRAFEQAIACDPQNFDANRSLASLFLAEGKVAAAKPYLRTAHTVRPEDYGSSYNLALAELLTGDLKQARALAEVMLREKESGELHNLLGRIDEKDGLFLPAANEFAAAARLDPSEENLFVWGSEMLLHRAYDAAITIFRDATGRYAQSPRLWAGLGMALYSRTDYVEAVQALLRAAELDPADPRCYLFLSKAYLSAPDQAQSAIEAFRKYATLEPRNARAQYYYAMALWKGRRVEGAEIDYQVVEALLVKSIELDGTFAESHLQLGILYNDEHAYSKALPEFERALQLDPKSAEAHFRLGRYYSQAGEKEKARAELDQFKTLEAARHAEIDKERAEVQQFVVSVEATSPASHP